MICQQKNRETYTELFSTMTKGMEHENEEDGWFTIGNWGKEAIENCLIDHSCNYFCTAVGLENVDADILKASYVTQGKVLSS